MRCDNEWMGGVWRDASHFLNRLEYRVIETLEKWKDRIASPFVLLFGFWRFDASEACQDSDAPVVEQRLISHEKTSFRANWSDSYYWHFLGSQGLTNIDSTYVPIPHHFPSKRWPIFCNSLPRFWRSFLACWINPKTSREPVARLWHSLEIQLSFGLGSFITQKATVYIDVQQWFLKYLY